MALRNIVLKDDPILRKTSRSVLNFDEKLSDLIDDMRLTAAVLPHRRLEFFAVCV